MELKSVSQYFDRTTMWDAYTGQKLKAKCQVTVWDAPRRDGLTTIRRTISMAYGSRLPKRHAIVFGGSAWIVSSMPNPDTFGMNTVRVGYVVQQAYRGKVANTAQVIQGDGLVVYLSRVWLKDIKDIVNASEIQNRCYVYFVRGEPINEGCFLYVDERWHICLNVIQGTAGLMIAECNELIQDVVVSVEVLGAQQFDPVNEVYTNDESHTIHAVLLDWRDDYAHWLASSQKEQVGDIRMRFAPDDVPLLSLDCEIRWQERLWHVVSMAQRDDGSVSVALRWV